MALLARGQRTDGLNPILDLFLKRNGVPFYPFLLQFRIVDLTTTPPTQVLPGSGYQVVDAINAYPLGTVIEPGRFAITWTVPGTANLGAYEIDWQFREFAASPLETFTQRFDVVAAPTGADDDNLYVTVPMFRAAPFNITLDMASDVYLRDLIRLCQDFIERATRQWYIPKAAVFAFDGSGSDAVQFAIPIITIDWLQLNNSGTNLDANLFHVYNGRGMPDDRKNPRIKLERNTGRNVFTAPILIGPLRFYKGRQNQLISGTWGYTEEDGSIPSMIIRAMQKLVIEKLAKPIVLNAPLPTVPVQVSGAVVREATDFHELEYTQKRFKDMRVGLSGFTQDLEVLDILKLFKAPLGLAVPADWSVGSEFF